MQEAQLLSLHVVSMTPLNDRPDFFASLDQQTEKAFQIVHVEQGGGNDSLVPTFPGLGIVHLRNFRDTGIARAHNQAIALALSRWPSDVWHERFVALCRPEVAFDPQWLAKILIAFQRYPDLMVVGPKILQGRAEYVGEGEWLEMSMTNQIYSLGCQLRKDRVLVFSAEGQEDKGTDDEIRSTFLLNDACVVLRASALASLQEEGQAWVDERMPAGQELFDLVWRAQRVGMRVGVVPDARIWFAPTDRRLNSVWRWRERYLTGPLRAKHDDWMMQVLHLPWFFPSQLRSFFDMATHPYDWSQRRKHWSAWRRSPLKKRLASVKPCSMTIMRRWFL